MAGIELQTCLKLTGGIKGKDDAIDSGLGGMAGLFVGSRTAD